MRHFLPSWKSATAFVTTAACVSLLGCGGSTRAATCGGDSTCGGNLAGTWDISSFCLENGNPQAIFPTCPQAQIDTSGLIVMGSIEFASSGMTYQSMLTVSGSISVTIPTSCLTTDAGTTVTCAELDVQLEGVATCTSASGACDCMIQANPEATSASGTYSTSDGTLTLSPTGAAPTGTDNYCVQGSSLTLIVSSTTMTTMTGTSGLLGTPELVLTKQ